jgi:hypothetical protein
MTRRNSVISGLALYGAMAALAAAGFLALGAPLHKHPAAKVDDWRRTASGWERVGHWPVSTDSGTARPATSPTLRASMNTHPAVLALGQLVGVLVVLGLFSSSQSHASGGLIGRVSRSFRASAFGS